MRRGPRVPDQEVERLTRELADSRRLVVELEVETRRLREELARLRGSAAGRLTARLQRGARRIAPLGTRRQSTLHVVAQGTAVLVEQGPRALLHWVRRRRGLATAEEFADTPEGRQRQYRAWLQRHEPRGADLVALREGESAWAYLPLISIVMPVHDPEHAWLEQAVESVRGQIYPRWELCIADDGSQQPTRAYLERLAGSDARVKVANRPTSGGIVAASNHALALAQGEWIGFLDHDDVLGPHALHALVKHLQEHPETGFAYSDEDKILPSGERGDPLFKPDWSPEMLLSANYITHFVIIRKQLVDEVGGLRPGFDGSQDHDLLLRVSEVTNSIAHVPQVLYSWRMVPGSAALSSEFKPLAREAGRRAVAEALQRRGHQGRVEFGKHPGFYNIRYTIDGAPSVAVVIPTRDRLSLLLDAVQSVERNRYPNLTIVIVDNGSTDPETLDYLRKSKHAVISVDQPFNFSALVNTAARRVNADHLLLVNNDVSAITSDWIEAMLEHSQRHDVGAVGARLVYADGRAQHEGIVVGRLHEAGNVEMRWPGVREVSAVTGACLMTRRSVFEEMRGFDESLVEAFNDVDYCLRVRQAGYRVVYTPLAELCHREGASRGRRTPSDDLVHFIQRWGDRTQLEDPYLNVNVLWPNPLRLRFD